MDLMDTPLGDEVKRIIDSKQGTPNVYMEATIHTLFGDVPALKLLNYDLVREYSTHYTDEISLVLVVPKGQLAYRIIPSRNELEITLLSSAMAQHGPLDSEKRKYGTERFRAVFKEVSDPVLEANARELLSEHTMDLMDFEVVEFQLFTKAMEQFSMLSCGGSYRRTKVGDLIRTLLLQQSSKIEVDNTYKPKGIDMVEPVDAQLREHIVIPHGMRVYDMPGYVHKHCGGVYSAGLSYYYQNDYWYVYPTFDYKRFEQASRQLNIIQVPENKLPNLDYTYLVEGSVVNIIATGELSLQDKSDLRKRSSGNGVRFADASRFFENTVEVVNNKAVMSRGKLNNEYVSSQQKTEFNNLTMGTETITANTMYQASQLASREGVFIQLIWQNSDPSLILPGMQTRISYYKNGRINKINAVVIGAQASVSYEGNGLVSGRYNRNTALLLFAANEVNQ